MPDSEDPAGIGTEFLRPLFFALGAGPFEQIIANFLPAFILAFLITEALRKRLQV